MRWCDLALVTALVAVTGCSQVAGTFLDLPQGPPRPAAEARAAIPRAESATRVVEPPPIEATLDPDSALALLPTHRSGAIDWVAAQRQGIIRPRLAIGGPDASSGLPAFEFKFDFHLRGPGPDSTFDAYFPHSAHTEWVDCLQCHGRIFRYRGTPIRMSDVLRGDYCGECHGRVAFRVTTACDRCHTTLDLPPGLASPELLGNIVMSRAPADTGIAAGMNVEDLPPATFPHWVHRIRYRCSVCHMQIFEPRAGANVVRMKDINEGRACGRCHNDREAFRASFGQCQRCHVPPVSDGSSS